MGKHGKGASAILIAYGNTSTGFIVDDYDDKDGINIIRVGPVYAMILGICLALLSFTC